MSQCGVKHPTAVRVGTDDEPEPVRCSRRPAHLGAHETYYGEQVLTWVDDDGPDIVRARYGPLKDAEPEEHDEPERDLRAVPEVGEWCPGGEKPNEAVTLDHVECGHCEYKIIGMTLPTVPVHRVIGATFTPPHDPERVRFVEMTLRVRTFGRERHEQSVLRSTAAALYNAFGDNFVLSHGDTVFPYDPVVEDGNEPPGYVPKPDRLQPMSYGEDVEL